MNSYQIVEGARLIRKANPAVLVRVVEVRGDSVTLLFGKQARKYHTTKSHICKHYTLHGS